MSDLGGVRKKYADKLRKLTQARSSALVRAFATVPRERYLGPGPWQIFRIPGGQTRERKTLVEIFLAVRAFALVIPHRSAYVSQRLPLGSFLPIPTACMRLSHLYWGAEV